MSNETENLESIAIQLRRAYLREWRKKNKEKVKRYERNRWLKKAAARAEMESRNNDEHKD